ncbi:39S ribosomal protein L12, mitochondrial-like isoform X3 [Dendronephthya gigantea]|uniref:39S ribosomal protein L12, mitochondrial-like isoform X2 n=1 Tax=Dendronephthya gigantea TaxID=151771 RepID=UPI001068EEE8|nr:39S ribosomal protein L12, mitochondrial-like isoform X2 [Dendronephthya gigantea]XP_028406734.1 39S ribosomal protein L12, mitochondrial-like isoform X3 [Dendronephthya gigantea]
MAAVRGMAFTRIFASRCVRGLRSTETRWLSAVEVQKEAECETSSTEKNYPEHIVNIVDKISQLTLVETAELNELLKVRLKIPDAPMMAMGAMPQVVEQTEVAEEKKEEQTEFTVKLMSFDDGGKIKLIKEVKNLVDGLNLVQAKKFVESVPQVLKENISKEDADKLKNQIEAAGGTVEIE